MPDADSTQTILRLAEELTRADGEGPAAAAIARAAAVLTGADAARVWMFDRAAGYRLAGAWPAAQGEGAVAPDDLAKVIAFEQPIVGSARAPFRSRLLAPLTGGGAPIGAVELLEKVRPQGPFEKGDLPVAAQVSGAADAGFGAVRRRAQRDAEHLSTLTRLMRLYDVSRSLSTALEGEAVGNVLMNRAQATLEVEAAYLWVPDADGEHLTVAAAIGPAAEEMMGATCPVGEGPVGEAAQSREGAHLDDEESLAVLAERPDVAAGLPVAAIAVEPVIDLNTDDLLGVLEVVASSGPPDAEPIDRAFLREVAALAAVALKNAHRFDAERKLGDLNALLELAQDLGGHLDVGKTGFTIVHKAASVLAYRRAAVGIRRAGRFQLVAVSGQTILDETARELRGLKDLLEWAAGLDEGLYVTQEEDGTIDSARPETREKFKEYFAENDVQSFLAIPLADDEGPLGVIAFESAASYGFDARDMEVAQLIAALATVALRNALLYAQIPMAGVFRPLAERQRRWLELKGSQRAWRIGAAVVGVLLLFVPVPLRVAGDTRLIPERRLPVVARVGGRVAEVLVREADHVSAGQIVARLDDAEARVELADVRAKYEAERREVARQRAAGALDRAEAAAARAAGLEPEVALWQRRVDDALLRAPMAGVVVTPRVEEQVGSRLEQGALVCEIVDPQALRADVQVPEEDAGIIASGMPVKIKLHAYPSTALRGTVERIGAAADLVEGRRVFHLRVALDPATIALRAGLTGRAKVDTGLAAFGEVFLRRPARWIWSAIWGWLP